MLNALGMRAGGNRGLDSGLLVIVVTGCNLRQWQALRDQAALPHLQSLCANQRHRDHVLYAGCPFSAGAAEAELFHGPPVGLPGDCCCDLEEGRMLNASHPEDLQRVEEELARHGEGLFAGGSVWGSLYQGGAQTAHQGWHPPWASAPGASSARDKSIRGLLREWAGPALDLKRGAPAVYVHIKMPASAPLHHWRALDRRIARLDRRARASRRRHYETWVLLLPRQHFTATAPDDLESSLATVLGASWSVHPAPPPVTPAEPADARRLWLARGPHLSHIYARQPLADSEKSNLAELVVSGGLAHGALWCNERGQAQWSLPGGGSQMNGHTDAHTRSLRILMEQDLLGLVAHPFSGQLILLHDACLQPKAPPEDRILGTALLPARTRLPVNGGGPVRLNALRTAANHTLGRATLPPDNNHLGKKAVRCRLMTYNVHGFVGMDGRFAPERVGEILAEQKPDIAALQEAGENGSGLGAEEFKVSGLRPLPLPDSAGSMGLTLYSRHPAEIVKAGHLPPADHQQPDEPRSVVWAKLIIHGRPIHIFAVHLGVMNADRTAQISALLGPFWVGSVPVEEPVIVCGDFNLTPGGAAYRRLAARLRDVQSGPVAGRQPKTFSTLNPIVRMDHAFVSSHFLVDELTVPQTPQTRVASDHFPLIVELALDTPSRT